MKEIFHVSTLEGTMRGNAGDYKIIGIHGEVYPCAKDIFEESYDKIENADSKDGVNHRGRAIDRSLRTSPSKDVELLSPAKSRIRAVISDLEGNIVILRRALIDME